MRSLIVAALLPAFLQESTDAEKLFRKMEKHLAAAKTLQFQFETALEGGFSKGANIKGSFVLADTNKMRVDVSGDFGGKEMKGELVSNGTKMRAVASYAKEPREHDVPANLNDILKTLVGRTGVYFAFQAVEDVLAGQKDKEKPLSPEKLFAVSDFKLGDKEKVGQRLAQALHYTLNVTQDKVTVPMYVTVWLDAQTDLPLKRIITDKKGKQGFQVTETYSGIMVDAKVSAKFELPK